MLWYIMIVERCGVAYGYMAIWKLIRNITPGHSWRGWHVSSLILSVALETLMSMRNQGAVTNLNMVAKFKEAVEACNLMDIGYSEY